MTTSLHRPPRARLAGAHPTVINPELLNTGGHA